MKNIILIHGVGGLNRESYFTPLFEFCKQLGLNAYMPSLGGYKDNITYQDWSKYFDDNLKNFLNSETIVVAQSLGTQFIVKYLAKTKKQIGLFISCAGPYNVVKTRASAPQRVAIFAPVSKLFAPSKEEYKLFKNLNFKKYSFYSNNDTFFTQKNLENYSKAINSTPILIKNKGHFNMESNVAQFSELEEFIKSQVNED